jgi:hypothetical protein
LGDKNVAKLRQLEVSLHTKMATLKELDSEKTITFGPDDVCDAKIK